MLSDLPNGTPRPSRPAFNAIWDSGLPGQVKDAEAKAQQRLLEAEAAAAKRIPTSRATQRPCFDILEGWREDQRVSVPKTSVLQCQSNFSDNFWCSDCVRDNFSFFQNRLTRNMVCGSRHESEGGRGRQAHRRHRGRGAAASGRGHGRPRSGDAVWITEMDTRRA